MEPGSDQSADDIHGANVLMGMVNSRPINDPKPRKEVQPVSEEPDLEDQISMADDDDMGEIKHELEEEGQDNMDDLNEFDPIQSEKLYRSIVFNKTSNEEILLLTSLYIPVPKTQAFYDKLHQIERVCKVTSSQNEYHTYLRNQRDYQRQLSELFMKTRAGDLTIIANDDLLTSKKDYQKKFLLKRRKALDSMINNLELYTPSHDAPFSVSEKHFYDIKNSDFTEKIIWKKTCKNEDKFGNPKIIKGLEDEKTSTNFLYINYNEKEEVGNTKSLVLDNNDFDSGRVDPPSFSKLSSMTSRFNKIILEFGKKVGKPGKIEIKKTNTESSSIWGGILGEKRDRSENFYFTVKKRKYLFNESLDYMPNEAPTNINQFYKEPYWNDLVFNREIHKLKERYGKIVNNILDPINSTIKEQENSASSNEEDEDDLDDYESKPDKSMMSDSSILEAKHKEQSMRAKITMLKHAASAYEYPFLKTEWTKLELRNFHRPEVVLSGKKWKVKLSSQIQLESRGEVVTSFSMLNSSKQLSLKEGGFLMMEYMEKRPLMLNNFGMASKIRRYYLGGKKQAEDYPKYVGKLGLPEFIDSNIQFPLIGNLTENSALAVLENNLFRVPIYCHEPKNTDFLMIKYQKQNGKFIWYLRDIDNLATSGQIEPKLEVMAPNARNTNSFQQKRIQAFIFNTLITKDNKIDIRDVSQNFTSINESSIRKQMKHINCEQQPDGSWVCSKLPSNQEVRELITPEEICQYESMLAGQRRLKDKGIKITSIDKVPNAIQKLKKEMDNKEISYLADFIEEELTITPWNLTSSYLKTKGEKGMMRITGVGDPTHGNCGFSFVRLPMKLPNLEKPSTKNDPSDYLPTNMAVTGTEADLRTLTKEDVRKLLLKMGCKREEIQHIGRWSGVAMLRNKASKLVSEGYKGSVEKYARGIRMSTKMQKEQCQRTIDEIFQKQIRSLGEKREYGSDKGSDSEDDFLTKKVAENINKTHEDKPDRIDIYDDNEVTERRNLEDFKITSGMFSLTPVVQNKSGMKKVLKRTVKMKNLQGRVTVKVTYIHDWAEIEDYLKRKSLEDQPKVREKNKKTAEAIKEKVLRNKDASRKKKKEENDPKKDEKIQDTKKQEKTTEMNFTNSEPPTSGAGKIICGKCGMAGHMKTNRKKCPLYSSEVPESSKVEKEGMVKTEGSKIKLSIDKIQQANEKKKEELLFADYNRPKQIPIRRRRQIEENPYENIAFQLKKFDDTRIFINPVKKETYPDYYNIVKEPMDLSTMESKAKRGGYSSAESFIRDLDLMVNNSTIYNGPVHDVTTQSIAIKEEGLRLLKEKELLVDLPDMMQDS